MLKMEEWLLIRDLYSQGFSISEIARKTGFDRKTVKKYIRLKTLPEPQKRPTRPSVHVQTLRSKFDLNLLT